jgi:hypothetical protein
MGAPLRESALGDAHDQKIKDEEAGFGDALF